MRRLWAIMTKDRETTELNDMANARVSDFGKFEEAYQCFPLEFRGLSATCRFNVVKEVLAHTMWMVSGFHNVVGTISDFTYHAMATTRLVADDVRTAYESDSFDVASVMLGTFVVMTTSWRQAPLVADWDIVWKRSLEEEEKSRILPPTDPEQEMSAVRGGAHKACYAALRRRGVTKTQLSACVNLNDLRVDVEKVWPSMEPAQVKLGMRGYFAAEAPTPLSGPLPPARDQENHGYQKIAPTIFEIVSLLDPAPLAGHTHVDWVDVKQMKVTQALAIGTVLASPCSAGLHGLLLKQMNTTPFTFWEQVVRQNRNPQI